MEHKDNVTISVTTHLATYQSGVHEPISMGLDAFESWGYGNEYGVSYVRARRLFSEILVKQWLIFVAILAGRPMVSLLT